jgi:hypothetical protein
LLKIAAVFDEKSYQYYANIKLLNLSSNSNFKLNVKDLGIIPVDYFHTHIVGHNNEIFWTYKTFKGNARYNVTN